MPIASYLLRRLQTHPHRPFSIMSSKYFTPPSTQAILSAQLTPPAQRRRRSSRSIIIISSSPEQSIPVLHEEVRESVPDSEDEEDLLADLPQPSNPLPVSPQHPAEGVQTCSDESLSHQHSKDENSIEIIEETEFTRILSGYKYTSTTQSSTTTTTTTQPLLPTTKKTNLTGYFQERKPSSCSSSSSSKPTSTTLKSSRVKSTLSTRVNLPKSGTSTQSKLPKTVVVEQPQTSFFTTWAANQAPVTRPPPKSKSRRKPSTRRSKENTQAVVLRSPRGGQESALKFLDGDQEESGRMWEKRNIEGGMWDVGRRGLEGELYDREGEVVFSQQLREDSLVVQEDVSLGDIVSMERVEEISPHPTIPVASAVQPVARDNAGEKERNEIVEEERPARRRLRKEVPLREDGMPNYEGLSISQLQIQVKKYGFKVSKSKTEMITLLEQCWKATQTQFSALETLTSKIAPQTPAQASSTAANNQYEGLPESPDSPAILQRLHTRISKTIKFDHDQSVHLGILRYEPVVIEDLVEWLMKRDMCVLEVVVRSWCDKEGVCCIWRENLVGGSRVRY